MAGDFAGMRVEAADRNEEDLARVAQRRALLDHLGDGFELAREPARDAGERGRDIGRARCLDDRVEQLARRQRDLHRLLRGIHDHVRVRQREQRLAGGDARHLRRASAIAREAEIAPGGQRQRAHANAVAESLRARERHRHRRRRRRIHAHRHVGEAPAPAGDLGERRVVYRTHELLLLVAVREQVVRHLDPAVLGRDVLRPGDRRRQRADVAQNGALADGEEVLQFRHRRMQPVHRAGRVRRRNRQQRRPAEC